MAGAGCAGPVLAASVGQGRWTQPFLELKSIGKTYPGVTALRGVSLAVARGEVVGPDRRERRRQSTLMKVLGGVVAPTPARS